MVKQLILCLALLCSPAWATFTLGHLNGTSQSIASGGTAVTVTSIPSGNAVLGFINWTTSGRSLSTCAATSSTCVVVAGCHNTLAAAGAVDCFYILSAGATLTSVTLTPSATTTGGWWIADYSTSNGPVAFDNSCTALPASSASPVGCTVTLSGSNDVLVATVACANTCSGTPSGWVNPKFVNGEGTVDKENTNDGTGPTWSMSPAGTSIVSGFALKETGGGGATCTPTLTLMGVGRCG